MRLQATAFVLVLLAGCAPAEPCSGWLDATEGDAGLVLTADEHGPGWEETACFQCHQAWNIHPVDCVDEVWLGMIDSVVDEEDTLSCTGCHGMNGTTDQDWVVATTGAS